MADVATLGITVDTKGAVQAETDLDKLTAAAGRAETATTGLSQAANKNLAPAMDGVNKGSASASNGMRMMAQQLSQVGQQTMATGNFVQALAIQLPDIGLGFGAIGAAAGLVAGVALPLLINALTNTSTAMTAVSKELDGVETAVSKYVQSAKAASVPTEELAAKYGQLSVAAHDALTAMAAVDQVNAINAVAASVTSVSNALLTFQAVRGSGGRATSFDKLADDFGMSADAAERLRLALVALNSTHGLENQANAARAVQDAMLAAFGTVEAMPPALRDAYQETARIVVEAGRIQGAMDSGADSTLGLASAMANARSEAGALVASVEAVAAAAYKAAAGMAYVQANQPGGSSYLANQYAQYGQGHDAATQTALNWSSAYGGPPKGYASAMKDPKGKKGAGAGSAQQFQNQIESLLKELSVDTQIGQALQTVVVEQWHAQAEKLLDDQRSKELLGEKDHKNAMLALEEEYHRRINDIQTQSSQRKLGEQADFWGAVGGLIAAGGGQATKAYAAVMGAQAVIAAYAGAAKALADPNITWWGRLAAYASVLGAGLSAAAAIKSAGKSSSSISSANYGISSSLGSSSSSSSISSTSTAAQATSTPQKELTIVVKGLDKNALYTADQLEQIFDGLVDVANLRGVSFI